MRPLVQRTRFMTRAAACRPPRPRSDPHFDDYALPSIRHDYVLCVTPWTAGLADDPGQWVSGGQVTALVDHGTLLMPS